MKTRIFLEASRDTTSEYGFIKFLLKTLGLKEYEIITVGGKTKLHQVKNKFLEHTAIGGKNIIIFDADTEETKGGYFKSLDYINKQIEDNSLEVTGIFLFPNNKDDGIFEDLLEHIAKKDKHSLFFDCFSDYENCMKGNYKVPDIKGKMYEYITIQKGLTNSQEERIKKGDWLWDNSNYWDFESDYLIPLKKFLQDNVKL